LVLNACGVVQEQPKNIANIKGSPKISIESIKKITPEEIDIESVVSSNRPKQEIIYPPISQLNDMSRKEVTDLLGQPEFKRQDSPALIWQYQTEFCALDIFLYTLETNSKFQVNHFEVRSRKKSKVETKVCFISLLKAHEKRRAG
jgi:hypothetical protein